MGCEESDTNVPVKYGYKKQTKELPRTAQLTAYTGTHRRLWSDKGNISKAEATQKVGDHFKSFILLMCNIRNKEKTQKGRQKVTK